MSYPENDTVAVALALAHIRQTIPGGPNDLAVAAFTKLAAIGDQAALAEVEDWLASHSLSIPYGDRDDDPTGWDLDPAALVALARWWEQLGLAPARSERLAAYALGEGWPFGPGSWQIYRTAAPHLADHVAPRLLAALPGADARRRKDIASGLGSTPTPAAIGTLISLLDDPDRLVRGEARFALQWVWQQRYATADQQQAAVASLVGALAAPSPAIRLGALQALPWLSGHQHRTSVRFPAAFQRTLPIVARLLLTDPDAAVRRLAAERVDIAGYHLDMLRPSYARGWEKLMDLPADDALLPLFDDSDEVMLRAGLYLAGRRGQPAATASRTVIVDRIMTLLTGPAEWLTHKAAIHAAVRLRAVAAIPALVPYLTGERAGHDYDAALVLGQLGYGPARPAVVRLLSHPLDYYRPDALEVLAMLDAAEGRTEAST